MAGPDNFFHEGERAVQERFDSARLASAVGGATMHDSFSARDRDFIESRDMFFLATCDDQGNLDCSYKGGDPGFVRIVDEKTLAFPSYDGNGMFMSAGNILRHPKVGMLFIDWDSGWRTRVNGAASIDFADPLLPEYPGAQFIVRVTPAEVFPNCPRYIHRMATVERSRFVPRPGVETPDHEWKDYFEEALPADQKARRAARKAQSAE
ncbi:MAG: pyridoxamine 5'-phosphate oxidase family protein [Thermoflexaceae bacterium]|nr:pyridoxamine 5'-phosphate oxidase family protein [Thermoflexaceae bacterium]